ncbi:MAG: coenzyme F420-0:L-glutamate ligase [Patescibacteria group bacterium]
MIEPLNKPIKVEGVVYDRLLIKTHLISAKEDIIEIAKNYTDGLIKLGDIFVISERVVAITQGRSFLIADIKPTFWARSLYKFVTKNPGGIGLRSPYTMELALKEAGLVRILLACLTSAVTKPFGLKGVFYKVAGNGLNAIDGPCDYTLPPGNMSAKLGPKKPDQVAEELRKILGVGAAIIDANDLGQRLEGVSKNVDRNLILKAFRDNPFGQRDEQTPMAILRRVQ